MTRRGDMQAVLNASALCAAVVAIVLIAFAAWATHFAPGLLSRDAASYLVGTSSFLSAFVALEMVYEGRVKRKARDAATARDRDA